MSTDGEKMLNLAKTRIGEKYVNVLVPKNNPNWHGPWDCAEFMSWLVYQVGGFLYGCVDNSGNPALTEAYTGAWQHDVDSLGRRVSVETAANTPGGILLRYPPGPGKMGHIVVCDGNGGTVEAMGASYGVVAGKVAGRTWHTGVFIPQFSYPDMPAQPTSFAPPKKLYGLGLPNMKKSVVKSIQQALADKGFDPGPIDGDFGPKTAAAVVAFQTASGLVADGQVGKRTAKALQIEL